MKNITKEFLIYLFKYTYENHYLFNSKRIESYPFMIRGLSIHDLQNISMLIDEFFSNYDPQFIKQFFLDIPSVDKWQFINRIDRKVSYVYFISESLHMYVNLRMEIIEKDKRIEDLINSKKENIERTIRWDLIKSFPYCQNCGKKKGYEIGECKESLSRNGCGSTRGGW